MKRVSGVVLAGLALGMSLAVAWAAPSGSDATVTPLDLAIWPSLEARDVPTFSRLVKPQSDSDQLRSTQSFPLPGEGDKWTWATVKHPTLVVSQMALGMLLGPSNKTRVQMRARLLDAQGKLLDWSEWTEVAHIAGTVPDTVALKLTNGTQQVEFQAQPQGDGSWQLVTHLYLEPPQK